MKQNDYYMMLAFETAFGRLGKTSPNPPVGAVIVKDDRVISTGGTQCCGSDHAEIVAIKSAGRDAEGSELYVSLEPCCHQSLTPPCTESIIRSGIKRVYIPMLDPNPVVAGKGVKRLKEAGVDVVMMYHLEIHACNLIRHFVKYILKGRPYVIHKSALTLDGRTATDEGDSKWITSDCARYITHRLRSCCDGVIAGKNTFINDNPALNARTASFPDDTAAYFRKNHITVSGADNIMLKMLLSMDIPDGNPLRVVAGLPENLSFKENIFSDDNYVFYADSVKRNSLEKIYGKVLDNLAEKGNIVFTETHNAAGFVQAMLSDLCSRGKTLLMLEGGERTAGSFLEADAIDQFFYIFAPKILGKGKAGILGGNRTRIEEADALYDVSSFMIENEIFCNAYKRSYNDGLISK